MYSGRNDGEISLFHRIRTANSTSAHTHNIYMFEVANTYTYVHLLKHTGTCPQTDTGTDRTNVQSPTSEQDILSCIRV